MDELKCLKLIRSLSGKSENLNYLILKFSEILNEFSGDNKFLDLQDELKDISKIISNVTSNIDISGKNFIKNMAREIENEV